MKLIKLLQTPHEYYCLKSYKEYLMKLYANARDGKDPNCRKCDDEGYIKIKKNIAFGEREWNIPELCDCVKSEKTETFKKIENIDSLIKTYNLVFGTLDDGITLDIFSKKFGNEDMIASIKKYLELGSGLSLYFTGQSGAGKTTILKILWQIYAINKINVFYLKANHFEGLYKNLFNGNAAKENIKSAIDSKIETAKKSDILLIDDIDSVGFSNAINGYYEIFDNRRKDEKPIILSSNKSYDDLLESLKRNKRHEASYIGGRITNRLLGLKIVEVELKRASVKIARKNEKNKDTQGLA